MYCGRNLNYYNPANYMNYYSPFYNVNLITVESGLEYDYIMFMNKLNRFLRKKYGRYFIGLQVYRSRETTNVFYVVASFRPIRGVYRAAAIIGKCVSAIYTKKWGTTVVRSTVFSFFNYDRVIPRRYC